MTYPTRKHSPRRRHGGRRILAELDRMFRNLLSSYRAPDGGLLVRGGPFEILHISGRALREAQQLKVRPLVPMEFEPPKLDPLRWSYYGVMAWQPLSTVKWGGL